jgi:chorismate mutase
MGVRGVRGAVTVNKNNAEEIFQETKQLVEEIIRQNELGADQVAAVFITVTTDLTADFPAKAVRSVPGWDLVPLMCATEIPVPGSLEKCIRIMMLANTDLSAGEIHHVFLGNAKKLRPDLIQDGSLTK